MIVAVCTVLSSTICGYMWMRCDRTNEHDPGWDLRSETIVSIVRYCTASAIQHTVPEYCAVPAMFVRTHVRSTHVRPMFVRSFVPMFVRSIQWFLTVYPILDFWSLDQLCFHTVYHTLSKFPNAIN